MLVKIEAADTGWFIVLDTCRTWFTTYLEAETFVIRLRDRINAPHSLPDVTTPADETLSWR